MRLIRLDDYSEEKDFIDYYNRVDLNSIENNIKNELAILIYGVKQITYDIDLTLGLQGVIDDELINTVYDIIDNLRSMIILVTDLGRDIVDKSVNDLLEGKYKDIIKHDIVDYTNTRIGRINESLELMIDSLTKAFPKEEE